MKLVEIDDVTHSSACSPDQLLPSDQNFVASRILSILDKSMNSILNRRDIDDGEKWVLYNQTLQKYLNHMKKTRVQNSNTPQSQQSEFNGQNQLNYSLGEFDGCVSDQYMSGVLPMRDSIDTISQPMVREFFEQARQNATVQSSPITPPNRLSLNFDQLSNSLTPQQGQPPKKTGRKKRVSKRSAANPMSNAPRCKIMLPDITNSRGRTRSISKFSGKQPMPNKIILYFI